MLLTDRQIREACEKGDIVIEPFDPKQLQPATYDVRVGEQGITTTTKKLVNVRETGYLLLQPGDFGVIASLEALRLGLQYTGRFGLRSSYARKGLIATTGPQIDPGFHGRLILGIANLSPRAVSLPYRDDLVSIEFHRLEEPASRPYAGPYQGRMELGPEEMAFVAESEGFALSEMLSTFQALARSVAELARDVDRLKWIMGLGIGVIAVFVGIIAVLVGIK